MRAILVNTASQNGYVDALTLRLVNTARIFVQVANAGVIYQLDESSDGKGLWTDERFLAPVVGSLDRRCSGIRLRSAASGAPAQVSAELLDQAELADSSDSVAVQTYTVAAGGGVAPVSPPAAMLQSLTEITGNVNVTAVTDATANTILTAPAFTGDGVTRISVDFFTPRLTTPPAGLILPCLFEDGVSLGRLGELVASGAAAAGAPTFIRRYLQPASGAHIYSIRAFVNAGVGVVAAGNGTSGNYVPAYIALTLAP